MCVSGGGASGTVPCQGEAALGGPCQASHAPHPPGLRPEEAATFFAGKVLWGSSIWGFLESTVRGEGVSLLAVARAFRVHTACEQTSAVCRENADCVYFSPEPAGSGVGGWGEGGGSSPARPQLDFRAEETYLRSPSFPPPAQPCPRAPSWLQPAQQKEGMLGHQNEEFPAMGS